MIGGSGIGSFRVEQAGCLRAVLLTIFAVVMLLGPPVTAVLWFLWDDEVARATRKLEELEQRDPVADAEEAMAQGEHVFVKIIDNTPLPSGSDCPGLGLSQRERLANMGYRSRKITLISVDHPTRRQQRLNENARRYALLYNQRVWQLVASPASDEAP